MSPLAPPPEGSVVTVGTFDGVHLGHLAVLDEIASRAKARQRASVLVTFEPHPLAVVNPGAAPPRLSTARERLEALATRELDRVVVLRFDRAMAALEPVEFVERILMAQCGMRELVIGYDHGFGRGRQGDVDVLRNLGASRGFDVDVVEAVTVSSGQQISSTAIRRAIAGGDLQAAGRMLGRRYSVSARVTTGDRRGRTIGFPTINLKPPEGKLLPPDGVWAVEVETPTGRYGGMMNQGGRPTVDDDRRLLEIHLFDFEGELYGRWVKVVWVTPIRPIQRFESVAALRLQLEDDALRARAALAREPEDLDAPFTAPE